MNPAEIEASLSPRAQRLRVHDFERAAFRFFAAGLALPRRAPADFRAVASALRFAAVVFASATTGPFMARFVLIFITPLPLALAGRKVAVVVGRGAVREPVGPDEVEVLVGHRPAQAVVGVAAVLR